MRSWYCDKPVQISCIMSAFVLELWVSLHLFSQNGLVHQHWIYHSLALSHQCNHSCANFAIIPYFFFSNKWLYPGNLKASVTVPRPEGVLHPGAAHLPEGAPRHDVARRHDVVPRWDTVPHQNVVHQSDSIPRGYLCGCIRGCRLMLISSSRGSMATSLVRTPSTSSLRVDLLTGKSLTCLVFCYIFSTFIPLT